jgi:predicted phage tail protein
MVKFLPAVILVQGVSIALFFALTRTGEENTELLLTIGLLEILFSVLAAYWFAAMSRQHHARELDSLKEAHAREREKLRVNAERQKTRIVNASQKQILKETRRAHASASFKIGTTFTAALALGALMLYTQFVTFGLLLLTTAGGGLAGYLARGRQMKLAQQKQAILHNNAATPTKKISAKSN